MTLRERLSDWFGHMFMTDAKADEMVRKDITEAQDRLNKSFLAYGDQCADRVHWDYVAFQRGNALRAIEAATRDGKSGTARKINRMAREALK